MAKFKWHRRGDTWLARAFSDGKAGRDHPRADEIEAIAANIATVGPQPLWAGYEPVYAQQKKMPWAGSAPVRSPDQVRTRREMGCLFAWIVEQRRPDLVVEFGTAFGVSALYWAAGLDAAGAGHLLTFEPNQVWHDIAAAHLRVFSPRVTAVLGTFEDNIDKWRGEKTIDVAFVDGIHTSDFVNPQVELLIARLSPGGLILLDDLRFSDDMAGCWEQWANDPRVKSSIAIDRRVGILEF